MIEIRIISTASTIDAALDDFAEVLAAKVRNKMDSPSDIISQRQAYREFGEGNVGRWRRQGKVAPVAKRPGKIEYKRSDLLICQMRMQDYLQ
jgi:hypothetical protein